MKSHEFLSAPVEPNRCNLRRVTRDSTWQRAFVVRDDIDRQQQQCHTATQVMRQFLSIFFRTIEPHAIRKLKGQQAASVTSVTNGSEGNASAGEAMQVDRLQQCRA